MNNYFKSFFKSNNAVLPLWNGMKYTAITSDSVKKATNEISDISKLVDDAMSRAAQAYKIPPALVRGDVAGISDAVDLMLTVCIDPIANVISEGLTGAKFSREDVINGSFIMADTTCIKHVDIFDVAANADKLFSCGMVNIDELREKAGMIPIGEKWSQDHYITKNYTNAKDGENLNDGDTNENQL